MSDARFTRAHRLSDYALVFNRGVRKRAGPVLFISLANDKVHRRLGIVVSKRVMKRATDRHRIKRVIREWFRRSLRFQGMDCVVVLRSSLDVLQLRQQLQALAID